MQVLQSAWAHSKILLKSKQNQNRYSQRDKNHVPYRHHYKTAQIPFKKSVCTIQQDTREMIDHKEYKKNAKTDGTIENKDQVGRQTCQS